MKSIKDIVYETSVRCHEMCQVSKLRSIYSTLCGCLDLIRGRKTALEKSYDEAESGFMSTMKDIVYDTCIRCHEMCQVSKLFTLL